MKFTLNKILAGSILLVLGILAIGLIPGQPSGSSITEIKVGSHYEKVSDQPLEKADMVIFFWYGCPHCLKGYEAMDAFGFEEKSKLAGLTTRKVPATGNPQWLYHAQLFHALDRAGMSHEGHMAIMKLIQATGARSDGPLMRVLDKALPDERIRNPAFNVTSSWIIAQMKSKAVERRIDADTRLANAVGIKGVPDILVNGKYLVTLGNGVGYSDLPVIALKLASEMTP